MTKLLLVLVVALVWLLYGVAAAVRERLATRFACWALPDGQPVTYRPAIAVAWLALKIESRRRRHLIRFSHSLTMDIGHDGKRLGYSRQMSCLGSGQLKWQLALGRRMAEDVIPFLESRNMDYSTEILLFGSLRPQHRRAEELLAELQADRRDPEPVARPLAMSLPVLAQAISSRAWGCVVGVLALLLAGIATIRCTRHLAVLEARLYERRYPPCGVRPYCRALAAIAVLRRQQTVAEAGVFWAVSDRAVSRWVETAKRDAGRPSSSIPYERAYAASFAQAGAAPLGANR